MRARSARYACDVTPQAGEPRRGGGGRAGNQTWREDRRGPCPGRSWRCGARQRTQRSGVSAREAARAQGRSCKARDGPSTDPTAAERSREASTERAQAWLARCASEAEHGRRERAKGRHGAASGARLAGPKAQASRVTRAVRSRIENGVRGARCSAHGAHRLSRERQAARARADGRGPCGRSQARAVTGCAGGVSMGTVQEAPSGQEPPVVHVNSPAWRVR